MHFKVNRCGIAVDSYFSCMPRTRVIQILVAASFESNWYTSHRFKFFHLFLLKTDYTHHHVIHVNDVSKLIQQRAVFTARFPLKNAKIMYPTFLWQFLSPRWVTQSIKYIYKARKMCYTIVVKISFAVRGFNYTTFQFERRNNEKNLRNARSWPLYARCF